jgi:TetR/AcrR family transcriptional repressor of bet genes
MHNTCYVTSVLLKILRNVMPKIVDHAERRRELVEASWDVIANDGIESLTMRRVASAAGCTTGRISHYFSNREELLSSALRAAHDEAERRMITIAKSALPAKERLKLVAYEGLPLDAVRLREWKVWIVFWAAAASSSSLSDHNRTRYRGWRNLLVGLFADIESLSKSESETRVDELLALIDGLGIRITLDSSASLRKLAKKTIDEYVARL